MTLLLDTHVFLWLLFSTRCKTARYGRNLFPCLRNKPGNRLPPEPQPGASNRVRIRCKSRGRIQCKSTPCGPNRRATARSVAILHGERVRTEVRTAPPTPQPQPFAVGVFSCQTARNATNHLGFLRTAADFAFRPPNPPWGLLYSLLALLLSEPGLPSGPEVRSQVDSHRLESACYHRTDQGGFFAASGSGGSRTPFQTGGRGAGGIEVVAG